MLVFLCQYRFTLIEMKDFFKNEWKTCSTLGFADENIAHLGLPAFAGPAGSHGLQVTLKIIDFHVSEKLRAAQVESVVLAARVLEICQKVWPDLPLTATVLFLGARLDLRRIGDAL